MLVLASRLLATGLLAYEQKRCRGHDRVDSDSFAQAWGAWRAHGEDRYSDRLEFEAMKFLFGPAVKCDEEAQTCVEIR